MPKTRQIRRAQYDLLPYITKTRGSPLAYGALWFAPHARVRRLIWVRHPVARILHGVLQIRGSKMTYATFECTVFEVMKHVHPYDQSCGLATQLMAADDHYQHYVPPQHCRCGLPCGAQYEVYRVEDARRSIKRVLTGYGVPEAWLPSAEQFGETSHSAGHGVNESVWLSARILAELNTLTALEQRLLGYKPYPGPNPRPHALLAEPQQQA
jgi:hypothetical protein